MNRTFHFDAHDRTTTMMMMMAGWQAGRGDLQTALGPGTSWIPEVLTFQRSGKGMREKKIGLVLNLRPSAWIVLPLNC